MAVVKDLTDKRFDKLVAVECVGRTNNGNAKWLCKCDCGGEKIVASWGLRSDKTHSCGCIKREQNTQQFTTHGRKPYQLYQLWAGIKNRCYNKRAAKYPQYGGRGIAVCAEWKDSFEPFRDWALSNGYSKDLTIERKDVNGNYCPENCCFATQKTQQNNRRNNRRITFNGETNTMAQWADITGISYSAIQHRLDRGWPIEEVLTRPTRVR